MMEIKFNKNFYSKEVIEIALSDFSHLSKGEISEDLELKLDCNQEIFDEFCNYVLGLMKNV